MTLARRLVRKNGYILNINYQKYVGFCMPILLDFKDIMVTFQLNQNVNLLKIKKIN